MFPSPMVVVADGVGECLFRVDGYVCMNMDENMKFHDGYERESDGDHDDTHTHIYIV